MEKQKPHVHFNESQIAEHDKTRGTRMKIDEPKTPFESSVKPFEDEENDKKIVDFSQLATKLERLNTNEIDSTVVKELKKKEFELKRKNHYKEFQAAKMFLEKHDSLEEED